jgi:CDP-diacylglycerol pyrophosphatase
METDNPGYCVDRTSPYYVVVTDIDRQNKPNNLLLVPRARAIGIEAPFLTKRPPPDYLYMALGARRFVVDKIGKRLSERDVGVAINSAFTRSQCQLHVHVDCVRPDVRAAVDRLSPGASGAVLPGIGGVRAWYVPHERVPETNFFALASRVKPPRTSTADQGIGLLEAPKGGVVMLLGNVAQRTGHAEELLDHTCKIAG